MRKFSLFLLLASSAVPAFAQADNDRGSRRDRDSRSEQSESRSERAENRSQRNRGRSQGSDQAEQRRYGAQRSERAEPADQGTTARIRERVLERREASSARAGDTVRNWRTGDRDRTRAGEGQSTWRQRERQVRAIPDARPRVAQPSAEERRSFTERRRRDYRNGNYRRWADNWRHDRRYDWRDYRNRHRSIFRLGFYYDPFGWNYRRWSIGSYLWPSYYGSRYWLNDPWHYRLPPAYGPYRWVRYWDDALLVNIYTGEVVDVIHSFFW